MQYNAIPGLTAYWFDLSNRSQKASPNDVKVRETIIAVIEEFFFQNPDILLYMCDTADEQQKVRARLFLRCFIIQRTHPQYQEVIDLFDREIAQFQSNK